MRHFKVNKITHSIGCIEQEVPCVGNSLSFMPLTKTIAYIVSANSITDRNKERLKHIFGDTEVIILLKHFVPNAIDVEDNSMEIIRLYYERDELITVDK